MHLATLRKKVNSQKAERVLIKKQIKSTNTKIKRLTKQLHDTEEAQELIKQVALDTQKEIEYRISSTVTSALDAVFDDPYEFEIDFVERRGKTECDIWFKKGENRVHPLSGSGFGAADIAAFALRAVCWKMAGKYDNFLLLDEPFSHLKGEIANRRAIELMKRVSREISDKEDLQIITISDERASREDIAEGADRVFLVYQKKRISRVKEV